ncbi:helix-turn-helix transcriptional regulator [Paraburkholderia xenovorans]|uniref:helix-turn-helix transcriptional regulator n=1 Tax=Paraburkholderia xenovorans TaxID=36873 RepID=UPI0038BE1BBE
MDYPVKTPRQLRPLLVGFRKAAGLTQSQVASHLGVAQQTYAQLEAKPESASMDRLFHVLKLLKVDIVLTHVSLSSANPEGHQHGRLRTPGPSVAAKPSVAKKRATTTAAKTAGTRKAAATPARGSGQGAPKPPTRKRVAPTITAPKKREDW